MGSDYDRKWALLSNCVFLNWKMSTSTVDFSIRRWAPLFKWYRYRRALLSKFSGFSNRRALFNWGFLNYKKFVCGFRLYANSTFFQLWISKLWDENFFSTVDFKIVRWALLFNWGMTTSFQLWIRNCGISTTFRLWIFKLWDEPMCVYKRLGWGAWPCVGRRKKTGSRRWNVIKEHLDAEDRKRIWMIAGELQERAQYHRKLVLFISGFLSFKMSISFHCF